VTLREAEVVAAFTAWLEADGWHVRHEVDWIDVVATRDGRTLVAEAKGTTTSPGLDVDTAYGQLLRRMNGDPATSYALVVPAAATRAARRVSTHVLDALDIAVYAVHSDESIALVAGAGPAETVPAVPG